MKKCVLCGDKVPDGLVNYCADCFFGLCAAEKADESREIREREEGLKSAREEMRFQEMGDGER